MNTIRRALKHTKGRTSFIVMVVSAALIYPLSMIFGNGRTGSTISIVLSFISLGSGSQFCQILAMIQNSGQED